MSAYRGISDLPGGSRHVRKVPQAEVRACLRHPAVTGRQAALPVVATSVSALQRFWGCRLWRLRRDRERQPGVPAFGPVLGREFLEDLRIDVPFHVSDRKQKAHLRSSRDVSSHNQTSAPPQMQKSRREGRQPPRLARCGRLSIVHRAQFSDLRVHGGDFFQSLFEELSNVPFAVDMQTRGTTALWCHDASQRMDQVSASLTRLSKKSLRDSASKCVADQKKSVYSPRRSVEIRY
jgi:hypothetical protein